LGFANADFRYSAVLSSTPGYLADHWCSKGLILLCIEGVLTTELEDGRIFVLTPGMSYQVADDAEPHRSLTEVGAKPFIVDCDRNIIVANEALGADYGLASVSDRPEAGIRCR
jgi:hypothetical protein